MDKSEISHWRRNPVTVEYFKQLRAEFPLQWMAAATLETLFREKGRADVVGFSERFGD